MTHKLVIQIYSGQLHTPPFQKNYKRIALLRRMRAIFAWLSLLASLASLFDVASGQAEVPLAIGKMPGAEVSF